MGLPKTVRSASWRWSPTTRRMLGMKLVSSAKLGDDLKPRRPSRATIRSPKCLPLIDFLNPDGKIAFRIYYQDTASSPGMGYIPDFDPVDQAPVDVAILCVGSFSQVKDHPEHIPAWPNRNSSSPATGKTSSARNPIRSPWFRWPVSTNFCAALVGIAGRRQSADPRHGADLSRHHPDIPRHRQHHHPAVIPMDDYRAPGWLPGGHLQTIVPALLEPAPAVHYRRERWNTPDGDFIDPSTGSVLQPMRRWWCCSTDWKARRKATTPRL